MRSAFQFKDEILVGPFGSQVGAGCAGNHELALAFNDKCDVVVATVVADDISTAERAALGFLNGDLVLRWAEKELGL